MRGAIIPLVPGKTLHLSLISGSLLGAIAGWITTKTTHITGRESCCLKKKVLSNTSPLCQVTKRLSVFFHTGTRESVVSFVVLLPLEKRQRYTEKGNYSILK